MSKATIFVTAATGNQGEGVVRRCVASPSIGTVYALVRDPSSAKAQALETLGAELVQGDLNDRTSLERAVQQVNPTALFLNMPPGPPEQQVVQARNVIEAAQACPSIRSLISSSALGTGRHESFPGWGPDFLTYGYWVGKHEIENLVRDAGFASWTIVRLGFFMQLFVPPMANMLFPELWGSTGTGGEKGGILRTAFKPDSRIDLVDGGDVGAVVAAALERPDGFNGRVLNLAGESLTPAEFGSKIARATGREIQVICESGEELGKRLGPMGPRLVSAQVLFSELESMVDPGLRDEFQLTTVEEFFAKYAN
ncbi:hypothetical protein BX600DRAFT_447549 [Xylariales sp. PMI_506]|nr:hypothetical protein BX600DRAFT_447549 [Xylariales sp. PMI_506]